MMPGKAGFGRSKDEAQRVELAASRTNIIAADASPR